MLSSLFKSIRSRSPKVAQASQGDTPAESRGADAESFAAELAELVGSRIVVAEDDNFDADRWPHAGEPAALEREARASTETLQDLLGNPGSYAAARGLLDDAPSRDLFMMLLAYRLLGHRHVRLPTNNAEHWRCRDAAKAMPYSPSDISGMFGHLGCYDVVFEGERISLTCWWMNIAWTFLIRQYYLSRGALNIAPSPGDRVLDCGACFADTALAFAASVGSSGRVAAFEIDPTNMSVARQNLARNPMLARRIALSERALAHQTELSLFRHGSGPGARIGSEPSEHRVAVTTIDALVQAGEIDRIDFIKMDIEGAERFALAGAIEVLQRFRPKLAISVYHRVDDLWAILIWLDRLALGYKFYLDHYTIHHEETVLYAIADTSA